MRFIVFLMVLLVTACNSTQGGVEERFSCPKIGFIKNSEKREVEDKKIKVRISDVAGECILEEGETELDISLVFDAAKPVDQEVKEDITLKYFISVLMDEKILLKKVFETELDFNEVSLSKVEEEHLIKLPIKSVEDTSKYKIAIGFVKEK